MFRSVIFAIILLSTSMTGCTDSTPNRTIVTFQIDSDGDEFWVYLYTVPRTKMGNFTISLNAGTPNQVNDIASSVFSHQKNVSFDNLVKDSDNFVSFTFEADLSEVYWELNCKLRISDDSTNDELVLDAIIVDGDDDEEKEWKLPYSTPLNYKK
jgi:hypothetical protein